MTEQERIAAALAYQGATAAPPTMAQQLAKVPSRLVGALKALGTGSSYGSAEPVNAVNDLARTKFWRGSVFGIPEDVQERNQARAMEAASMAGPIKRVAPQDEALRLAQQRAALPVSEGGLGLPPNNTAEQRAAAMGFRESGYSGTSKNFTNYDSSKAFGAGSGSREGPLGAWLTDDPRVANTFAEWSARGQGGDVVYPLMIRGSKPYEPTAYSEIKDILDANTQFRRPPYRMMQDTINYENAIRDLESKGDYVALRNISTDALDKPITQFLVTDPTRLRSRFAAFDPFRKDVATAAAMGVAAPDLLAKERK
jgi:hypothetical protein